MRHACSAQAERSPPALSSPQRCPGSEHTGTRACTGSRNVQRDRRGRRGRRASPASARGVFGGDLPPGVPGDVKIWYWVAESHPTADVPYPDPVDIISWTRPITSSSASLSATWSAGTWAGNCAWTSTSTPAGRRRTFSFRSRMSTWIRAGTGSTASISRCRRARSSRPRDTPTVAAGFTDCASPSVLMILAVARASSGGTATRLRSPFTLPSPTHNRPQPSSR
jgi:hypothetical protein